MKSLKKKPYTLSIEHTHSTIGVLYFPQYSLVEVERIFELYSL